jgi:hypothetical protein
MALVRAASASDTRICISLIYVYADGSICFNSSWLNIRFTADDITGNTD